MSVAVVKRSVSVEAEVWRALEAAAADRPGGVSRLVAESIREWLARRDGLAGVREWEDEHGALTTAELAAADRLLDGVGLPDGRAGPPTDA